MMPSERFRQRTKQGERGCILWTGTVSGSGYGRFMVDGRSVPAHRWAYEQVHGPVPEDRVMDHLCRIRLCVNPDHLEAVTNATNVLRGVGPTAINARKTTCRRGHSLSGNNLRLGSKGERLCKTCVNQKAGAWREKNAESATPWRRKSRACLGKNLSPQQRSDNARRAAIARWERKP